MNAEKELEKMGIQLPVYRDIHGTEEEVESHIKTLSQKLKEVYQKILAQAHFEISDENLAKYEQDFSSLEVYRKCETISDQEAYEKLNKRWWELNTRFFELMQKKLDTKCDEYDMDYRMRSLVHQLCHETPQKRRERLEKPLDRKLEAVEKETAEVDEKLKQISSYSIEANEQDIRDSLLAFYEKVEQEAKAISDITSKTQ